jgi:hypothetical protein
VATPSSQGGRAFGGLQVWTRQPVPPVLPNFGNIGATPPPAPPAPAPPGPFVGPPAPPKGHAPPPPPRTFNGFPFLDRPGDPGMHSPVRPSNFGNFNVPHIPPSEAALIMTGLAAKVTGAARAGQVALFEGGGLLGAKFNEELNQHLGKAVIGQLKTALGELTSSPPASAPAGGSAPPAPLPVLDDAIARNIRSLRRTELRTLLRALDATGGRTPNQEAILAAIIAELKMRADSEKFLRDDGTLLNGGLIGFSSKHADP